MPDPGLLFDLGPPAVAKAAVLSPCGLYRYTLGRTWDDGGTRVNFIMLNPSTADAEVDDPTIKKCVRYAQSWSHGGLVVTNLYAFRATQPKDLWKAVDSVGPDNDEHLEHEARAADIVVCAWGNGGSPVWRKGGWQRGRGPVVLQMLDAWGIEPRMLKVTGEGMPAHPLYLPEDLVPKTWEETPKPDLMWVPVGFDLRR
jgi:hypothetical protein